MNVALRDLRADDAAWLDGWLGRCAASVAYDLIDQAAPSASLSERVERDGLVTSVIVAEADPIGIATYRLRQLATIEFVGLQPSRTRRGYGHAGAALVEEKLRAAGARTIYAPASTRHGIAVYFWIRLGYRPLLQHAWPCRLDGVAWLARDLGK